MRSPRDVSYTMLVTLSPADREIRLGLWKIHVLHHAAERDVWGRWLLEELAEHGHRLSPGTLYPALNRMEEHGWLRRTSSPTHPRGRQTFRITLAGRKLLEALRHDLRELCDEVLPSDSPPPPPSRPRPRARPGARRLS